MNNENKRSRWPEWREGERGKGGKRGKASDGNAFVTVMCPIGIQNIKEKGTRKRGSCRG